LKDELMNPFTKAQAACSLPKSRPELEKYASDCQNIDITEQGDLIKDRGLLMACTRYLRTKANAGVALQRSLKKHKKRCVHDEVI